MLVPKYVLPSRFCLPHAEVGDELWGRGRGRGQDSRGAAMVDLMGRELIYCARNGLYSRSNSNIVLLVLCRSTSVADQHGIPMVGTARVTVCII